MFKGKDFKLYYAGARHGEDKHFIEIQAPRLYSYANDKEPITRFLAEERRGPLLVDSGAFSVAHSGAVVDIDEYIKYINTNTEAEWYIALDVIPYPILNRGTAAETARISWENYLYMIKRLDEPFKLLPVYHFGESLDALKRILNFEYKGQKIPYICIGGRHGVSSAKQSRYFDTIFRAVQESNNPDVDIHVLGMTVFDLLERFPFKSADSTSHLQYSIYGGIMTKYGVINISSGNKKRDNFDNLTDEEREKVKELVDRSGFTLEQLRSDFTQRMWFNVDYCEEWVRNYKYRGPGCFVDNGSLF